MGATCPKSFSLNFYNQDESLCAVQMHLFYLDTGHRKTRASLLIWGWMAKKSVLLFQAGSCICIYKHMLHVAVLILTLRYGDKHISYFWKISSFESSSQCMYCTACVSTNFRDLFALAASRSYCLCPASILTLCQRRKGQSVFLASPAYLLPVSF